MTHAPLRANIYVTVSRTIESEVRTRRSCSLERIIQFQLYSDLRRTHLLIGNSIAAASQFRSLGVPVGIARE